MKWALLIISHSNKPRLSRMKSTLSRRCSNSYAQHRVKGLFQKQSHEDINHFIHWLGKSSHSMYVFFSFHACLNLPIDMSLVIAKRNRYQSKYWHFVQEYDRSSFKGRMGRRVNQRRYRHVLACRRCKARDLYYQHHQRRHPSPSTTVSKW